ncbi:MAG: LLM class flavin-dependent oxidoreductase [Acidobacteriaceae bacterium]
MGNSGQPALRLSVLDQSPVPAGFTPTQALDNSLDLARHVDRLGYTRLWYSEHHAMDLLACTAPEILIARSAAATTRIRVGSGGIMLPHYSPFKIAEVFRTLHAMFPNRIDLGIGRAPGGGRLETIALRRDRNTPMPDDFLHQLAELRAFLHPERFPALLGPDHPFGTIRVAPDAPGAPDIWLLGSSMWSSVIAAQEGLPYAFAHFFSPVHTREAIEYYQHNFQPATSWSSSGRPSTESQSSAESSFDGRSKPEATLAIGVICAPTLEEAQHLEASVRLLQRRIRMDDRRPVETPEDALRELAATTSPIENLPGLAEVSEWPRYIVGTPESVRTQLLQIATELNLNELIINTITHSHEARKRSFTLLAEAFGLNAQHFEAPRSSAVLA